MKDKPNTGATSEPAESIGFLAPSCGSSETGEVVLEGMVSGVKQASKLKSRVG